jgi:catechol 2,3-dioxygenase-like lactoylglutathione lyase family enzyme
MHEIDSGFTHVAFMVRDLDRSIDFYTRYTAMQVIHQRSPNLPSARHVAWLSDRTRLFALVLVQADEPTDTPLGPFGHLGVACATKEEIDAKTAMARREGVLKGAGATGEPVGYYVFSATRMAIRWNSLTASALGWKSCVARAESTWRDRVAP